MHRFPWAIALTLTTGLALAPTAYPAEPAEPASGKTTALPITQVTLYTSGVGHFQRQAEVKDTARIDLSFPATDVNDLLKSMILQDLSGGRISAVSYDSHDPIDKALKGFAINLSGNPSLGQMLNQARGEKVEVVLQQGGGVQAGTLTGSLLGIEKQKQPAGKEVTTEVEMLNLWCAEGVRSVKLADVQRVRFLNPTIEGEVKHALEVLAQGHDTQRKSIRLQFTGKGTRQVRVGYVVENPIWKTSYRLVLDHEGKLTLQGWAVVENASDEDWKGVRLRLVSGRPVSFRMDLYQPLYVPRPLIDLDLFAGLRPPVHESALEGRPATPAGVRDEKLNTKPKEAEGMTTGVVPDVTPRDTGDFFQYVLDEPVTLARQKSALLPIINKDVAGTRVSIYNEKTHAKHPMLGLRLKNTTGLHLMQGPITVFEEDAYAGDARVTDIHSDEERLISYAVDLGTEVEALARVSADRPIVAVKIVKGVLTATRTLREEQKYTITNRSTRDRAVVIEQPFRPEYKLVTPEKAPERVRDIYRFAVAVKAGQSAALEVVEERRLDEEVKLLDADDQTLQLFVKGTAVSDKVKAALQRAVDLRGKVAAAQREVVRVDEQLKDLIEDQGRIRKNLERVPPSSESWKRYMKKLDDQETEIEKLQTEQKRLRAAVAQQRHEYEEFLAILIVE
jgi:hypothetical protein